MSFNNPYTPPGPTAPPYSQGYGSYGGQGYSSDSYNPYGRQQSVPSPSSQYGNPSSYGGGYGGGYQAAQGGYQAAQGGYGASTYPPPTSPYGQSMFPPNTDAAIIQIFQQADLDRNGTVDANELQRLLSVGREPFTPRTVRLMVHLFAENQSDPTRIGRTGFVNLWKELGVWHEKFREFDRDNSGTIDVEELQQVLRSKPFYFAIPPAVLDMLVKKYDHSGHGYGKKSIGYGEFVECGFIVKGLTEKFRDHDRAKNGNATFDYTSFMLMVIPYIAA